jgi:hypothetical protein
MSRMAPPGMGGKQPREMIAAKLETRFVSHLHAGAEAGRPFVQKRPDEGMDLHLVRRPRTAWKKAALSWGQSAPKLRENSAICPTFWVPLQSAISVRSTALPAQLDNLLSGLAYPKAGKEHYADHLASSASSKSRACK